MPIIFDNVTFTGGILLSGVSGTPGPTPPPVDTLPYVVVGLSTISTSEDGITWTSRTSPNTQWFGAGGSTSLLVVSGGAVGLGGTPTNAIATSPDGITWTGENVILSAFNTYWRSVAYGNGTFVAVSDAAASSFPNNQLVLTSPDGVTWTQRAGAGGSAGTRGRWQFVIYANNLFVASGWDNKIMTSPDGITWTLRTTPIPPSGTTEWYGIAYGNGLYVVCGSTTANRLMTSPDAINWTAVTVPAARYRGAAYGNGIFVVLGREGELITSPDGVTWTSRTPLDNGNWRNVVYRRGLFLAVRNTTPLDGTSWVSTSTNGIDWTPRSVPGISGGQNVY